MSTLAMSTSPRLSSRLVDVATGLRPGHTEVFDLTASSVCKNAVRMVQKRSPRLGKLITTLAPIAFLGYGAYLFIWKPLYISTLCESLYSHCFAEIVVEGADPLNYQVTHWMANQKSASVGRALTLQKDIGRGGEPGSTLEYISSARTSWYEYDSKHGKRWLRFERMAVPVEADGKGPAAKPRPEVRPDVAIRCYSILGDSSIIRSFLEHLKQSNKVASNTYIYRVGKYADELWDDGICRPSRKLETVAMESKVKEYLVTQVAEYLSEDNRTWFAQRGLPLRKGILLYGPPGTGKTSFCTALAGHFNLELYILSFTASKIDDDGTLQDLFDALPANRSPGGGVTLSGLLNAIDGAGAAEGRLLIMTSNSANSLDPALVRAGRTDHKVLMGNAVPEVGAKLFTQVYTDATGNAVEAIRSSGRTIEQLASLFGSKIPANALSPADVQVFLLAYRKKPTMALAEFDAWAKQVVAIKASGRNVEDRPTRVTRQTPERRHSFGGFEALRHKATKRTIP